MHTIGMEGNPWVESVFSAIADDDLDKLDHAVSKGSVIDVVLENGEHAEPMMRACPSALLAAAFNGSEGAFRYLLGNGADVSAVDECVCFLFKEFFMNLS